jgi:hypothetical protein
MWVNGPGFDGILRLVHGFSHEGSTVRRSFAGPARLLIGVCAAAAMLTGVRPAAAQVWRPFSNDPRNVLEGNWQSCRDRDGTYAERVYDHIVNGVAQFEVHMGPRREFAIFKGVQDEHRDHDSPDNLLKPFRVTFENGRAKQRWEIPSLNLAFTATMAGGSRTDCESWYLLLEPLEKTSH